ncbi:MAG: 2-phosphosulfolactate phosphatase [Chloroflexota bacterium]|jgi:2-phosphosulfolactate phosphatase
MVQVSCEWGPHGARKLSESCDVTIIVDVLSFSTCVDIAAGRSILVLPYSGPLEKAEEFAQRHDAELARRRGEGRFSLSPSGFISNPYVERVVLPSPNGATLTLLAAQKSQVLCGCLRNAAAIAEACAGYDSVGLVPAGEKWPDGSLRPALEDWLGAGAIISHLSGTWSSEARAAAAAFEVHQANLLEALRTCPSGQELISWGYAQDVEIASQLNASTTVPRFRAPAYEYK